MLWSEQAHLLLRKARQDVLMAVVEDRPAVQEPPS
jgi:hypothetical protein